MPEAGGLTSTRKFIAVIIGIIITLTYVFATAPHPVTVAPQIITPVPTPPPVVITSQPTPASTQCACSGSASNPLLLFSVTSIVPIAIIGVGVMFIVVGAFSGPGIGFLSSVNTNLNTSIPQASNEINSMFPFSSIVGIVIGLGGILVAFYIIAILIGPISSAIQMTQPCICP